MNKERVCPICLHKKNKLLFVQKFAEHFEHIIVCCTYCNFVYVSNAPSQKYYNNYYKNQSKYEGVREHETHDEFTFQTFNQILKKYVNKNARILDVGCSTGKLLNYIKANGYKNLLGVEPALECRIFAKKNYNIIIKTSTLENFRTKKKYDLIILSQVLEHITELRSVIIKCQLLLKSNGMIFIGVPDADNFYKKFDEPFGEFSTEHINFFSKKSIFHLMSGFKDVFQVTNNFVSLSLWKKASIEEFGVKKYIGTSSKKMKNILRIIKSLPKNTIIWGVGALTQRLLKTTHIKKKIFKFVDSNNNLIGKEIENIKIISPKELDKFSNPILICSFRFKDEIIASIRKNKIKNKIIIF